MRNLLLFVALCLSWGSTWVAIKVGVMVVPPLFFAGTRFLVAGGLILGVTGAIRGWGELRLSRGDLWPLLEMSALVVSLCFALIFWGERYVSASVTAIVVQGIIPIFLPFFAYMLGYEPLSVRRILSIVLGVLGLGFIFLPNILGRGEGNLTHHIFSYQTFGLLSIVLGTLSYCYGSVLGRPFLARNSAFAVAGWQNLLGGGIILLATLLFEAPNHTLQDFKAIFTPNALFAWGWLVVVGSAIGFVLYIVLLKAWGATKVSPYAFLTPIVAISLDRALFGTTITQSEMLGMAVIFVAMVLAFSGFRKISHEKPA